jgi:hypothetical protein
MEATRLADIVSVRGDVQDFIQAAEKLLSPAMRTTALTAEECYLIREYVMSLSHARHPWSKGLPIKYT